MNELVLSREALGVYQKTALPTSPPEGLAPELKSLPPLALASTITTRKPPIESMMAYNAQLVVGGKDEAIRKSATAFKTAAVSMKRALSSAERYWTDALRARNANWTIVPAPLPFDGMTRRSADNNAMDICIFYGLEYCKLKTYYYFLTLTLLERVLLPGTRLLRG